ncbi:hypothetical protein VTJ04DRAFT_3855 [Mycothermus thermophilus]|uniref:uncharacterized protein n=1 Tax=Humicola insolens TaxID=85995 RepID=UPI0037432330
MRQAANRHEFRQPIRAHVGDMSWMKEQRQIPDVAGWAARYAIDKQKLSPEPATRIDEKTSARNIPTPNACPH